MAKKHFTDEATGNGAKALNDAMGGVIREAQSGFLDLEAMALAVGALLNDSEQIPDKNTACAINVLYQLAEKAGALASTTDVVCAKRLVEGGAS